MVILSLSQWFPVTERGSGLSRFGRGGGSGSGGSGDSFSSSSADLLLNVAAGAVSRPADVAVGSECRCT